MMYKCDKCKGIGNLIGQNKIHSFSPSVCDKCHGTGELNWLENIFGKKEIDFREEIVNKLAQQLAEDIDKEILKSLIESCGENK